MTEVKNLHKRQKWDVPTGLIDVPKDTNDTIVQLHQAEVSSRDPDIE